MQAMYSSNTNAGKNEADKEGKEKIGNFPSMLVRYFHHLPFTFRQLRSSILEINVLLHCIVL